MLFSISFLVFLKIISFFFISRSNKLATWAVTSAPALKQRQQQQQQNDNSYSADDDDRNEEHNNNNDGTVIPTVIGALGTIPKVLVKRLED